MTKLYRYSMTTHFLDFSVSAGKDSNGPWIFDPDHKIDISKFCNDENEPINPADGLEKCSNCVTGYYDKHIDICGVCGHERR